MVGNGSILAPWWDRPLIPLIGPYRRSQSHITPTTTPSSPPSSKKIINPFLFFRELDVVFMLLANGLVFALWVSIQATTSLLFENAYPYLDQSTIGVCFLPMGAGAFSSSLITGRLLDWQYRKDRAIWEEEQRKGMEKPDAPIPREVEVTFPVEKTRLKWAMAYTSAIVVVSIGYGWAVDRKVNLAVPLILQFICEFFIPIRL